MHGIVTKTEQLLQNIVTQDPRVWFAGNCSPENVIYHASRCNWCDLFLSHLEYFSEMTCDDVNVN